MKPKAVSGTMLALLLIGMLTLVFNIQPTKAESTTIIVPDDYEKIQWAIGNASDGDTIFVCNGTYSENVFVSKAITLIGESKEGTIIDGGGVGTTVEVHVNNVTITGFTIENSNIPLSSGIEIYNSNYVNIIDNIITNNNGYGVEIYGSSYLNIVSDNIITNNKVVGILIYDPDGKAGWNVIKVNTIINNNGSGIVLTESHTNTLEDNVMANQGTGISFTHAANNTIKNNLIADNQKGIHLWGYLTLGNSFFHNNFINNTYQASGEYISFNAWDDGYPSGGNYWSDYNGSDLFFGSYQNITGSDGIGDTPYIIDENNQDNYPLMNPWTPTAPVVTATIDINPDTLNLKSRGKWITCYIELSEGYSVSDIDRATILLNGTIPVDQFWINKPLESVVGDCDNDTVPDLMLKFNRAEVIEYLLNQNITYENATLTVTGELYDGTLFEGSDMIMAKMPSKAIEKIPSEVDSDDEYVPVMPEFPSFLILPLFMIATLLVVIIVRRKHRNACIKGAAIVT